MEKLKEREIIVENKFNKLKAFSIMPSEPYMAKTIEKQFNQARKDILK